MYNSGVTTHLVSQVLEQAQRTGAQVIPNAQKGAGEGGLKGAGCEPAP
jgi:hypothetical protein